MPILVIMPLMHKSLSMMSITLSTMCVSMEMTVSLFIMAMIMPMSGDWMTIIPGMMRVVFMLLMS